MLRYPAPAQSAASEQGARPQQLLDVSFALCLCPLVQRREQKDLGESRAHRLLSDTPAQKAPTAPAETPSAGNTALLLFHSAGNNTRVTSTSNTRFGSLAGLGLGLFPTCQQPPKWDAPNPAINSWKTPSRGSSLSRTSWCARVALGSITKPNLPAGLPKGDPMGHLRDCLGGSLRGPSIAGGMDGHRAVGNLEQPHAEAHGDGDALLHRGELIT